jgi:hypothetical protein
MRSTRAKFCEGTGLAAKLLASCPVQEVMLAGILFDNLRVDLYASIESVLLFYVSYPGAQ